MKDNLKDYIQQHRSSFDSVEPPDLWAGIQAGMAAPIIGIKIKTISKMIKYGFSASAIAIVTSVAVYNLTMNPKKVQHKNVKVEVVEPVRTVLDSSPSLIKILPVKKIKRLPVLKETQVVTMADSVPAIAAVPPVLPIAPIQSIPKDSISNSETRTQVDTFFKGVKRLEVKGKFCSVTINGQNSDQVHFKGEMKEGGGDMIVLGTVAYKNTDYLIKYRQEGELLKVWIEDKELPHRVRTKMNSKVESYLNFDVPVQTQVSVDNSSGNITASGLNSKKTVLKTEFGNLKANNMKGEVELSSSSGNIAAGNIKGNVKSQSSFGHQTYDSINGDMLLRSSSGDITIDGLQGNADVNSSFGHQKYNQVKGNIHSVASSGDIRIKHLSGNLISTTSFGTQDYEDIEGNITGKASSGSIKINGSKGNLSLGTSFGNISGKKIKLMGSSDFNASSGNISMDLLNELKELHFDLVTSSGRISLKKENHVLADDTKLITGEGNINIKASTTFGNQDFR